MLLLVAHVACAESCCCCFVSALATCPYLELPAWPGPLGCCCCRGDQHDSSMVEYFLTENLLGEAGGWPMAGMLLRSGCPTGVSQLKGREPLPCCCSISLQATSIRSCSSAATAVATWRCRLVTCRLQCLEVSDMCSGKRVHVVAAFIAVVTICCRSPLARCTAGAPDAVDFDPEPAQPADGATSVVWGQRECVLQATVLICGSLAASCVRHFTCYLWTWHFLSAGLLPVLQQPHQRDCVHAL